MIRLLFHCLFSITLFSFIFCEKSCDSKCSPTKFPRCGVWIHSDNSRLSSGVYQLDDGLANLTCVITSLPRPSTVRWYFEPESSGIEFGSVIQDRIPLACSSLRTTTECKYNEFEEHRVTSVCLIKINRLEQTGSYFCAGKLEDLEEAESSKIRLNVYGISNITIYEESEMFTRLEFGKIGQIRVRICANRKPHVVWVHRPSGRSIAAGSSSKYETAFLLHHELNTSISAIGPIAKRHYCYLAALVIGRVGNDSNAWTVMAWNSVDSQRFDVPVKVIGIPLPSKGFTPTINRSIVSFLLIWHLIRLV